MGHPDGTDVIDLINPANEEITGSIISASKKMLMMQLNPQKVLKSFSPPEQKKKVLQEIIDGMDTRRRTLQKSSLKKWVLLLKWQQEHNMAQE